MVVDVITNIPSLDRIKHFRLKKSTFGCITKPSTSVPCDPSLASCERFVGQSASQKCSLDHPFLDRDKQNRLGPSQVLRSGSYHTSFPHAHSQKTTHAITKAHVAMSKFSCRSSRNGSHFIDHVRD